jgi:hypothetical protein
MLVSVGCSTMLSLIKRFAAWSLSLFPTLSKPISHPKDVLVDVGLLTCCSSQSLGRTLQGTVPARCRWEVVEIAQHDPRGQLPGLRHPRRFVLWQTVQHEGTRQRLETHSGTHGLFSRNSCSGEFSPMSYTHAASAYTIFFEETISLAPSCL